ncbi:MAG TPA: hypothetical protein PLV68_04360, partial [Ilumatobacteraceae bacterium]|nr:hypothetical protein [Ilumatobacteraceae bacterium]
DHVCLGDVGVTWQEQQERMATVTRSVSSTLDGAAIDHLLAGSVGHSPRGDGGALVFHIVTPDGSLLDQDTSGHWTGVVDLLRPDVAIIAAAGRANINGDPIQGALADYVADHAARCQARTIVLSHHDDWLPGFSIATDVAPIRAALAERCPETVLLELGYVDGTAVFAPPADTKGARP